MNKVWEALGGVKVGMALMVFVVSTVLLCVKFITEDAWTYMATFCVLTAVGGDKPVPPLHQGGMKERQDEGHPLRRAQCAKRHSSC